MPIVMFLEGIFYTHLDMDIVFEHGRAEDEGGGAALVFSAHRQGPLKRAAALIGILRIQDLKAMRCQLNKLEILNDIRHRISQN